MFQCRNGDRGYSSLVLIHIHNGRSQLRDKGEESKLRATVVIEAVTVFQKNGRSGHADAFEYLNSHC